MTNPKTKRFSSRTGYLFTGIDGDRNHGITAQPMPADRVDRALAEMFEDGVIMSSTRARIVEDAGAVAVVTFERGRPIAPRGGVSRVSDPDIIDQIIVVHSGHGPRLAAGTSSTLERTIEQDGETDGRSADSRL
jgi:hypothetical protein